MPTSTNTLSALLGVDADDHGALSAGLAGSPFHPGRAQISSAPYSHTYFTHFNTTTTIPGGLTLTEDGTTAAAATYGLGLGGEATLTSEAAAAKTEQLATGLLWQANRQPHDEPIVAQVRFKTGATITATEYFVGLTDAVADTDPIALSTSSTFTTSVPTNGVYMGYSATPTSGAAFTTGGNKHVAIGIKADADSVLATGCGAFAAAIYYTYRIELDYLGNVKFFVNGQQLGTTAAGLLATTATVPLCLSVWATPRTTTSAVLTVDYMGVTGA